MKEIRGISPGDRLDRVLGVVASAAWAKIRARLDLPFHEFETAGRLVPFSELRARRSVDVQLCLKVLRAYRRKLLPRDDLKRQSRTVTTDLIELRNISAHRNDDGPVTEWHVQRARELAEELLQKLECPAAAREAANLAERPEIAYVAQLRRALVKAARERGDVPVAVEI